jgi:hypothetical protein
MVFGNKREERQGILNLLQEQGVKKIPAAALEDTDGSSSHPYQFFKKTQRPRLHFSWEL